MVIPATASKMWATSPVLRTKNITAQIIRSNAAMTISIFFMTFKIKVGSFYILSVTLFLLRVT
jgi:hypothetical protein